MTAETDRGRRFDAWADEYDRYRPTYPDQLFETIAARLDLPEHPHVADLGAGTGRASLAMAALGWHVTAIEPGRPMLEMLRAGATDSGLVVATVQASAEETGLDPASVDMVTVAQAFHWFDKPRAVDEMARIVRSGGGIAVFWNVRDEERDPFVRAYHTMLEAYSGPADSGRYLQAGRASGRDATRAAFDGVASFEGLELVEVRHDIGATAEAFLGMAFTASYVRALPQERQDEFRRELTELLRRHGHVGQDPFNVPYRIDLWIARRSRA